MVKEGGNDHRYNESIGSSKKEGFVVENLFDLSGKIALITGSARGLGKTIAHALATNGATVILNDINEKSLAETEGEFRSQNLNCGSVAFNVTNEAQIKDGIAAVIENYQKLDILVNNAGINRRAPIVDMPASDWDAVLDVNLKAYFLVSRTVAPFMMKNRSGKIINMASLLSEGARPTVIAYTTNKGGVKSLTQSMAIEWAEYNIQVNGIGPGYFKTEMNKALADDPKFNEWVLSKTPAKRWGDPSDLRGTAVFLASAASDFINGHIIYVDGGWLAAL